MSIRVLVADDHRMIREACRMMLTPIIDIDVVGEASTGNEALVEIDRLQPDILLIDIGFPDINGIEVVQKAIKQMPNLKCIALSEHTERIYVEGMLKAGAKGYVVKTEGAKELVDAIETVCLGEIFLSPKVTQIFVRRLHDDGTHQPPPHSVLGKREIEVLRLLAGGKRSSDIAKTLNIALGTVEVHRRNIRQKLGIQTIADLIKYAINEGLVASKNNI